MRILFIALLVLMAFQGGCGKSASSATSAPTTSPDVLAEKALKYEESFCHEEHLGLTAIGRCSRCGQMTPCVNMRYCDKCAEELGVCCFCGRKTNWTRNTDPAREVPLCLWILQHSQDQRTRQAVIYALAQMQRPGTLEDIMAYRTDRTLWRSLAEAVGEFRDRRYLPFLHDMSQVPPSETFDDEIQRLHHAAAESMAKIGGDEAFDLLKTMALTGKGSQQEGALLALGDLQDERVASFLMERLAFYYAQDDNWQRVRGEGSIRATLTALQHHGSRTVAVQLLEYLRTGRGNAAEYLQQQCLTKLSSWVVPEILAAIDTEVAADAQSYMAGELVLCLGGSHSRVAVDYLEAKLRAQNNPGLKEKWTQALEELKTSLAPPATAPAPRNVPGLRPA